MGINTNTWNRIRYTLYQPIYDGIAWVFGDYRKRSLEGLKLHPENEILILGAGTGLDLEYLTRHKSITAIDITPAMIANLNHRAKKLHLSVDALVMDGSNLEFEDNSFDVVILHLIIAVIPDPVSCLMEVERVLKPGGKFTIMDKFIAPGKKANLLRLALNVFSNTLATDLNRDIDELLTETNLIKTSHEKLGSIFWLIQGKKAD